MVFAEKSDPKEYAGQAEKYMAFVQKVDRWSDENPDEEPDGDEFKQFLRRSRPTFRQGDKNKLYRKMVVEQATKSARDESAADMDELRREQARLRSTPIVEKSFRAWTDSIATMQSTDVGNGVKLPVFKPEVLKFNEDSNEAALVAKHPIEGPIWVEHWKAAKFFLDVTNDLVKFDSAHPTHRFLLSFLGRMENDFAKQDGVRNGKNWVTRAVYMDHARSGTAEGVWCFEFDHVGKMLITNSQILLLNEHDRIRTAGYVYPDADKEGVPKPALPASDQSPPSPKAESPKVGIIPSRPSDSPSAPREAHPLMKHIRSKIGLTPSG